MPIRKLLIANRGEIARRVARTCRELGIEAVAIYSEADRGLPHVREADLAVCVGPAAVDASYLNAEAILQAAQRVGADAIHPGYGFLSENAAFARAVQEAGLTWVGPPPEAMEAMADKAAARQLAARHDVPVVPGFDDSQDDHALQAAALDIGFPLLIKARAGGGGRGMRRVDEPGELPDALASARREALSAFGSGEVLLERYVAHPRHVEVQVFADAHGRCVHLFERECSIQRRHQKIVEEAPCPALDPSLRATMGAAAVRVARAAGYVGAGTVEFLLDAGGRFYFLEMNTRLQVEHPVTEEVTGLDLVALQIAVAEGQPLPFEQHQVHLNGHAIEVRLYAEDPLRNWLPATGTLRRLEVPLTEGLRVDSGYEAGDVVSPHYDPLIAKVIAWGPDRVTATRRLRRALGQAWAPGVITNLPLLRQILDEDDWEAADLDTHFLERVGLPRPPPLNLADGALAGTLLGWIQRQGRYPAPGGWRLYGAAEQEDRWRCGDRVAKVSWQVIGADAVELTISEEDGEGPVQRRVRVVEHVGDRLTIEVDGVLATWRVAHVPGPGSRPGEALTDGDLVYVHTGMSEAFVALEPRFPSGGPADEDPAAAVAPTPGTVTAVHVEVGEEVVRGQKLVTLEAMKMEHAVLAPQDGRVAELRVGPRDAVDQGTLLVRVEPLDEG